MKDQRELMGEMLNQVFNNNKNIEMVSNSTLLAVYRLLHVKLFEAEDTRADFYKPFDNGYHLLAFEAYERLVRDIELEQLPRLRETIMWIKGLFIARGVRVGDILYRDVEDDVRTNRLERVKLSDMGVLYQMV